MINTIRVILLSLLVVSCAHAPKGETARFESNYSYLESDEIIARMIYKCWERPETIFSDAIIRVKRVEDNRTIYTLGRDNTDIPFMPFANIILINNGDNTTSVIVEEGDVTLSDPWGVDRSVKSWISGNTECTNM